MKKSFFLVGLVCSVLTGYSQTLIQSGFIVNDYQAEPNFRPTVTDNETTDRDADDIIWISEFDDPEEWTSAGPSTDFLTNGWSIDNTLTGWYYGETGDMGTDGNFARFVNGDPNLGEHINSGPFTLTYNETLDLSGIPAPHLEFEQYGNRYYTMQSVQVSTDGGFEWIDVIDNLDQYVTTANATHIYPKPMTKRANISEAISGDPSNVMIRLHWDGIHSYVAYGWFIDNIRIVEGHDYDCGIYGPKFLAGELDYYQVPVSQSVPMTPYGILENNGAEPYLNVVMDATVDYPGGSSTVSSSSIAELAVNESVIPDISAFVPTETGTHTVNWNISGSETDTYEPNHIPEAQFEVTENIYGRDNKEFTGAVRNLPENLGAPFLIGNVMDIFSDGTVGGIEVRITDHSSHIGQFIYGQIRKYDEASEDWILVASTLDYEITSSNNGTDVTLTLEDPLEVAEGDSYLVLAGHYGSAVRDVSFGYAQWVEDFTVWGYRAGGTELFWLEEPRALMVRLDFRDFSQIETNELSQAELKQNYPNPFSETTQITYNLLASSNVVLEFTDIAGKTVQTANLGVQNKGSYTYEFASGNLSAGIYYYTLILDDQSFTKKMVIE